MDGVGVGKLRVRVGLLIGTIKRVERRAIVKINTKMRGWVGGKERADETRPRVNEREMFIRIAANILEVDVRRLVAILLIDR